MMGMDATELTRGWRAHETPDIDGIVYAEGSLRPLEHRGGVVLSWLPPLAPGSWAAEHLIDFDTELCRKDLEDWIIRGGESAAHGSVGWLSATHVARPDVPAWVLLSSASNPFDRIGGDETVLTGTTTSGYTWHIPVLAPHLAEIVAVGS